MAQNVPAPTDTAWTGEVFAEQVCLHPMPDWPGGICGQSTEFEPCEHAEVCPDCQLAVDGTAADEVTNCGWCGRLTTTADRIAAFNRREGRCGPHHADGGAR